MSDIIIGNYIVKNVAITSSSLISKLRSVGVDVKKGDIIDLDVCKIPPNSSILIDVVCPMCGEKHEMKMSQITQNKHTKCKRCRYLRSIDRKCQFCGEPSNRTYNGRGICNKHRFHIIRYGNVIQGRYDLNTYIDKGDYYEILFESKGKILDEVGYISKESYDIVKDIRWHLEVSSGDLKYIANCSGGKTTRMHTLLLKCKEGNVVDHIDGNGLNNTLQNLREANYSENSSNFINTKNKTSFVKGVTFDKKNKKWLATITKNKKTISLGLYEDLEDAISVRKKEEISYHGSFANSQDWASRSINIAGIHNYSIVNGIGIRKTVFVSGCWWDCKMCQNVDTHNKEYGEKYTISDLITKLGESEYDITISGGDGLTYQLRETYEVVKELKLSYGKNIWLYTGFKFEDILQGNNPLRIEILKYIDVLVDGRFNYENRLKNPVVQFRGDDSQRIIDIKKSLTKGEVVLYDSTAIQDN